MFKRKEFLPPFIITDKKRKENDRKKTEKENGISFLFAVFDGQTRRIRKNKKRGFGLKKNNKNHSHHKGGSNGS